MPPSTINMKTFITDIFPKIQKFSQKLDDLTLLTNQHWVSIDLIITNKTVYIFRTNNELLISTNGKVEKAKWEYLGNKSILIDKSNESYLFKHGFFDENIFALKVDSSEEYAVFVNENKYDGELNSIEKVLDFLKKKYLDVNDQLEIESITGQKIKPETTDTINIKRDLTAEQKRQHEEMLEFNKNIEIITKWIFGIFTIAILVIFYLVSKNK